ncbi:MAG: hypothetical protein R3279_11560 [Putridiphycobacter sp.]|nr:hypothetical protein [Putridiphycobacter sp.]
MKSILFAITILLLSSGMAKERLYYSIVKTEKDSAIHKDSLYISGKINYDKVPAINSFGKVASLDFKVAEIVARSGSFQIKIHRQSKGFYFFQEGYKEVVVDLSNYSKTNRFEVHIVGEEYLQLIQAEKPVVYLYSAKPTKTTITLSPVGQLAFTYPTYQNNWQVETVLNGHIKDLKTGKLHPYLFWEANQPQMNFDKKNGIIEGFTVKTDTIIPFLENQLALLGLNSTESTDFITYWAPRLQKKDFAIIQFRVNQQYDSVFGHIQSSTQLNYQLRVGMLFEVFNHQPTVDILPPKYALEVDRIGFGLVEWGGIELSQSLVAQ